MLTPLEITHHARRIKQSWRRGDISTDQFQAAMDGLRQVVARRNEIC